MVEDGRVMLPGVMPEHPSPDGMGPAESVTVPENPLREANETVAAPILPVVTVTVCVAGEMLKSMNDTADWWVG